MAIAHRKVIIVTGSSSGIGAAVAKRAARENYNVLVNYNSNRSGADAVAGYCMEQGVEALAVGGVDAFEQLRERQLVRVVAQQVHEWQFAGCKLVAAVDHRLVKFTRDLGQRFEKRHGALDLYGVVTVVPLETGVEVLDLEQRLLDQVDVLVGGTGAR